MGFLEQLLEGFDSEFVRDCAIDKALIALKVCEKNLSELGTGSSIRANDPIRVDVSTDLACPLVPFAVEDVGEASLFPFGALHVAEGTALCVAGFEGAISSLRPTDYLLAVGLLLDRLEGSGVPIRDSLVRSTLHAICDLSFFTPLGRIYGRLRGTNHKWGDLHPGHRFLKILDCVGGQGAWIESLDEMESLANFVCTELNWPHPKEFLQTGNALDNDYFRRHRDACALRLEDYAVFYKTESLVDTEASLPRFLESHMPMVSYREYGTVCGFPDDKNACEIPFRQVHNCFVNQLLWNVMGDDEGIDGEYFPSDLRFDVYFTNLRGLDDFWRIFAQKHGWAERSRFSRWN